MPSRLGKVLKKAGKDVGKAVSIATKQIVDAVQVAAKQTTTNMNHLNEIVQTSVIKNADLGSDRQRAREAILRTRFLAHAVTANASFDMVIQGVEQRIAEIKSHLDSVESSEANQDLGLNTGMQDQSQAAMPFLSAAKANLLSAEKLISEVRLSKATVQAALDLADAQFKILQNIPDAAMDNQAKIEQGKAAAKQSFDSSQNALKLFAEADICGKSASAHHLLEVVSNELSPAKMLKDQAAWSAASMQDASGLDLKLNAEFRASAANLQTAQPAITHQYKASNAVGASPSSAAAAAAPIASASTALANK
jgi:hypothetical protein